MPYVTLMKVTPLGKRQLLSIRTDRIEYVGEVGSFDTGDDVGEHGERAYIGVTGQEDLIFVEQTMMAVLSDIDDAEYSYERTKARAQETGRLRAQANAWPGPINVPVASPRGGPLSRPPGESGLTAPEK